MSGLVESSVKSIQTSRPVILHARVVTSHGGGPDKTILNSPRYLREAGYDCVCAFLHPPADPGFESLQRRADSLGVDLVSIPDRGLRDLSVIRRLLELCRDWNVTVWHGHDYKSNALGLLLRRFHPMRLVSTVHGWVTQTPRTRLYYGVDRACLRHYERVICVSDELLHQCLDARVPAGCLSRIDNAIDVQAYAGLPDRQAARGAFQLPADQPVVVALGRLSHEKGFDVLIRAFHQLLESGTSATLAIGGDGPERQALQTQIQESGLQDHIRLTGHVPDPRTLFAAADAFVLSSRMEGLPNVLLEAFACRVPTICTSVGAVPQVVTDEVDALLVPSDDADALTVSLTRLLTNDELRGRLAAAGRKTVEDRFSFEGRMRKVIAVYDDLLRRPVQSLPVQPDESIAEDSPGFTAIQPREDSDLEYFQTEAPDAWADHHAARSNSARTTPGSSPSERRTSAANQHSGTATLARMKPRVVMPLATSPVQVELTSTPAAWNRYLASRGHAGFYQRAEWQQVLSRGLNHQAISLQATQGQKLVGVLPLMLVQSRLFGRFLVSLPYLNSAGIVADSPTVATSLVDSAIEIADRLDVRYLELRHEAAVDHPELVNVVTDKVHMRLPLPATTDELWSGLKSKLRSQLRKPLGNTELTVEWGRHELLDDFYRVFTANMRDLGTPPFSRQLFAQMLDAFPCMTELCCVRLAGRPVASGLLVHGPDVTEVPSASSLREFNSTSANMLLYWHLLTRAVERGQKVFDFGRSSRNGGTCRFKAQWGAQESPAVWQHYVRSGGASDMRPGSGKFDLMIRAWQHLPVWLTRLVGPAIVRGIP